MRRGFRVGLQLMALALAVASCDNKVDPADTTPPVFDGLTVEFRRVSDNLLEGPVDARNGYVVDNVQRDRRIVVKVSATDPESGVRNIRLAIGEYEFECRTPGSEFAEYKHGTFTPLPDAERTGTTVSGTPSLRNATFTFDPYEGNALRLVCPATDETTPLIVTLKVAATNGNGLKATSPEISITYLGRPPGQP